MLRSFRKLALAFISWLILLWSLPANAQSGDFMIADFETVLPAFDLNRGEEFPGAKGSLLREEIAATQGRAALKLAADFSGGGQYVSTGPALTESLDIDALKFRVRSKDVAELCVRLVDSSGQVHQQHVDFPKDDQWQQVIVTGFNGGKDYQHWGGKNDGQWHGPAKEIRFILEKGSIGGGSMATVSLDDISATGRESKALALQFAPQKTGNVFVEGERVEIAVKAQGANFTWEIRDWQNALIAQGKEEGRPVPFVLELPIKQCGYFTLHASMTSGQEKLEAITTVAVLAKAEVSKGQESAFGVCTHFAQGWDTDIVPLIARAGIKHVRDEIYWDTVEETPGKFAFPSRFDHFMAEFKRHDLRPLVPLTFENPHYDAGKTPHTTQGFAGYTRYGTEVLKQYPQLNAVEIWNEYNGDFCKGPALEDRPGTYTNMLAHAFSGLKQARVDTKVVGVDTAGVPMPYLEKLFKKGALDHMDVVSVHPYRYQATPEGMDKEMAAVDALIKKYHHDKSKPIWATEYGWLTKASEATGDLEITENDQAKFLVRGHALMLSAGVEKAFWYLLKDTETYPSMGLLRSENDPKGRYAPKPAYVAYATMIKQLNNARFVEREKAGVDVYVLRFEDADKVPVRVMWSVAAHKLKLRGQKPAVLTDLMGVAKTLPEGSMEIALNDAPVFLRGEIGGLPVPGAVHEEVAEKPLADSTANFSSTQGEHGWFYGYYDPESKAADHFVLLPDFRVTDWNQEWFSPIPWLAIIPTYQHPAVKDDKPVAVVRRWVSSITGKVNLTIKAKKEETKGDGVNLRVLVDGKEILVRKLGGGAPIRAEIDSIVEVNPGTKVDFAIDPGPAHDINSDGTSLAVTIRKAK